jgi:hypothetical protein
MLEPIYLKVISGNVVAIGETGNYKKTYYRSSIKGNKAIRAYWNQKGIGFIEVYLENGKILIINSSGSILKTI